MILVTGATGRVGSHIVRALRRLDQPVRALVRRGSEYFWLNDTGCAYFFGDLRDEESLRRACAGVAYVVAASGVEVESRDNDHQRVTVDGHAALWRAAHAAGVQRVVLISALGVDRGYPNPWFDARLQAEESLQQSGVDWSILRAAPLTRPLIEWARRASSGRGSVLPGTGRGAWSPISVRDLALLAVASIDAPEASARTLAVGGADIVSASEAVARAFGLAGDGAQPRYLGGLGGRVASNAARTIGRRWRHRTDTLRLFLGEDFVAPTENAANLLGRLPMGLDAALEADLQEVLPLEDPAARDTLVVHRRLDATVYRPGKVSLDELPDGPLRYLDT